MTLSGLPLVLLPGWGFTPAVWKPVIAELVQLGVQRHRILTPNLPFHPQNTLAQTLGPFIQALPGHAHLIGWSLGGELALALAQAFPERLASLTLVSSTPCFMNRADWSDGQPDALLDDFDQRLAADPAALLKRFSMLIRHGDSGAGRDRVLGETLALANDTDPSRLAAGLSLLRDIDLRATVCAITMPTLLIHGTQDAVVPIVAAEWLAKNIEKATLLEIHNASHALPLTHSHPTARAIVNLTETRA